MYDSYNVTWVQRLLISLSIIYRPNAASVQSTYYHTLLVALLAVALIVGLYGLSVLC